MPKMFGRRPGSGGGDEETADDRRLDPVRWRRPGRRQMARYVTVAALLCLAAALVWSGPAPPTRAGGGGSPASPAGAGGGASQAEGASPSDGISVSGSARQDGAHEGGAGQDGVDGGDRGARRLPVPDGLVGVPVRPAEPAALGLISAGDRVDLLRGDRSGDRATVIAGNALVLAVTGKDDPTAGGLLLALTPENARQAATTPAQGFAVQLRPD